jgi:phosphoribosylformylglycinamidine synthase
MSKVYRCYTEKRKGFDVEAQALIKDLSGTLGVSGLTGARIFNRYDVEGIDDAAYSNARTEVFSEPQCDDCFDENLPDLGEAAAVLAVESVPGQYNQRADSCAQCIQMMTCGNRPLVAAAKIYVFYGELSGDDMKKIRADLINPVEAREASPDKPATLEREYPVPPDVPVITGFAAMDGAALFAVHEKYGLAMDMDDLGCFQAHFKKIGRDPTVTELKLIDTYWSDHCRHTTFSTHLDDVEIEDYEMQKAYKRYLAAREEVYGKEKAAARPKTLMDMATLGTKVLKKRGELPMLDESEEINACSVHMDATVDGEKQDWLLMFKNETHNHPTEIEPFGGAATCIGGAIRDPLSGRAYVYQAMRVTGCGDPTVPVSETIPGKLPQRRIATRAAAGYSSYGNQIGLATGIVQEFYHPGYIAKHMEVGAVVAAVRADHVVRECPEPGDVVLLLGGRTGRDGIGGATGASKSHNMTSLVTMASEVQKGNAPEERKIQRLFRDKDVVRMIRRCNDFGAGGVSVAIGELADGLDIDLDQVRKKYDGLDGTEIAISESQERMAVVVRASDKDKFIAAADRENLECYQVATVTAEPRMIMRWRGKVIVDLDREFLSSTGAEKHAAVRVADRSGKAAAPKTGLTVGERFFALAKNKNICSQRGLVERFDSTIGAGTVLMPYGGKSQRSPSQAMAALIPAGGDTEDCSVMSFGFDPDLMSADPFDGARSAVIESLAKLVAAGCSPETYYLTLQEYFEKLRDDPERWGKPFSALLGALDAQIGLGAAAIGGKDSMSGSFDNLDVPPTLISFAIAPSKASRVISTDFKAPDHAVCLFRPASDSYDDIRACWRAFHKLCDGGTVMSAWAVTSGGAAEGLMKMSFGNNIGFLASGSVDPELLFARCPGSIAAECTETPDPSFGAVVLGSTSIKPSFYTAGQEFSIQSLLDAWEAPLESVYPTKAGISVRADAITCHEYSPLVASKKFARPRAVIAAFPGTNCEIDTARALEKAGIEPEIYVIRNLSAPALEESVDALEKAIKNSQMIVMPGGFSGGDEPDGSGKFICSFYRNPRISAAVSDMLYKRDGLMMGICNGFQALLKLGLLTTGEICAVDSTFPTLTYNLIGRHQSRYVTTRVASVKSPWMAACKPNELYRVAVSHGEGRFVASDEAIVEMFRNGQIATQYVDRRGNPTMDIEYNPNGSVQAIEGIFSPDGRVFGKMGHIERCGKYVAKNIPGEKYMPIFESGAAYYR